MSGIDQLINVLRFPPTWHARAACRGMSSSTFFPVLGPRDRANPLASPQVRRAKYVCVHCPVKKDCLKDCLDYEREKGKRQDGIWGGTLPSERSQYGRRGVKRLLGMMDEQARAHGLKGRT